MEFSHWIQRQMNGVQASVAGHPSCNAAMSIIEWMRGEEIVPVPNNRIIMTSGNARFENYYNILPQQEDQGLKRKHHEALKHSKVGQGLLERLNAFKAKKPRMTKRRRQMDEQHPVEVVG